MALRGDGKHFISLDRVIRTLRDTGADMHDKYKETSRGGLAVSWMLGLYGTAIGAGTLFLPINAGVGAGKLITLLCFFAVFSILLVYSVALTNTLGSFMEHQLHMTPLPRAILSLVLILGLMAIVLTCWAVATFNPSILGMIETKGGPIIACLLFLMPMYAIRRVPSLRQYSGQVSNVFVGGSG